MLLPFNLFIEESMELWSDKVRYISASFASSWISQKASTIAEKKKGGLAKACVQFDLP